MPVELRILDARDADDRRAWLALLADWPAREVFTHPSYVALFARPEDRALAAVGSVPGGFILYPFVLREIDTPHLAAAAAGARDTTSPYGYGGAFISGDVRAHAEQFWTDVSSWQRSQGIVAEFLRFSLFEDDLLPYPGEREQKLVNVVRTLELDEESLWRSYEHKVRKNVNKARRSGVTIDVDTRGERVDDFLRIYETTMDRRDAAKGFYFPRSFFETIVRELDGWFAFFHARREGRTISTELALVSGENVYSYLGGTDAESFEYRPNDLLKHELILWSKRAGKRRFVFGGGYSMDDGIFRYKRTFAPEGLVPYYVGRRVVDEARFGALSEAHVAAARAVDPTWTPDPSFFPVYRGALPGR
jgi:hypothetical protein